MRTVDELEIRTMMFWNISRAFFQRQDPCPTTATALRVCSDAITHLNPQRPIASRFKALNHAIIMGRGKKRKTPKFPNNILKFGS